MEGNYLLLDERGWRDLADFWSFSVFIAPALTVLEDRLVQRWLKYGFVEDQARERARANDLPNAERVIANALPSDLKFAG